MSLGTLFVDLHSELHDDDDDDNNVKDGKLNENVFVAKLQAVAQRVEFRCGYSDHTQHAASERHIPDVEFCSVTREREKRSEKVPTIPEK